MTSRREDFSADRKALSAQTARNPYTRALFEANAHEVRRSGSGWLPGAVRC